LGDRFFPEEKQSSGITDLLYYKYIYSRVTCDATIIFQYVGVLYKEEEEAPEEVF